MSHQGYSNSRYAKESLPIDRYKRSILYALEKHRVLILIGDTGSGKSTRVPQFLFSAGIFNEEPRDSDIQIIEKQPSRQKLICITQPRRVAAVQLTSRVAQDLNCDVGSTVGYAIRFKEATDSEQTKVKFVTEGLLIREMMTDPLLTKYSVIMVDEVHERNLNTDILLGLLKCIMLKRNDLRLIVCSATMDIAKIERFFTYNDKITQKELIKPAKLRIEGKSYPVKIFHIHKPVANYMEAAVDTVKDLHESSRLASGKILVFLTGLDEVEYVCEKLRDYAQTSSTRLELRKLIILPLHASLKAEEISQVFEEQQKGVRVCIVSTNVAETSLTIDDVAFVVDCGFAKLKMHNHITGIDSLVRVPISKSSAKQRAGRAGRTREGQVYRLYPESEYRLLDENTVPEIQRCSLAETIVLFKSLSVQDIQKFPLMSPMPRHNLVASLELLHALGAIDDSGQLTETGSLMARFNLDPKLSKVLVNSTSSSCNIELCKIVAMLQVKEIYVSSRRFTKGLWSNSSLVNICVSEGDLLSYLNIFESFVMNQKNQRWAEKRNLNYQALLNAVEISERLQTLIKRCGIRLSSSNGRLEILQRSIVSGLFSSAAYLHPNGEYKTIRGEQTVFIHPTSVFSEMIERPKYLVFGDILNTTKPFMRHLMIVEQDWLLEAAPNFYTFATSLEMMRNK